MDAELVLCNSVTAETTTAQFQVLLIPAEIADCKTQNINIQPLSTVKVHQAVSLSPDFVAPEQAALSVRNTQVTMQEN